MSVIKSHINPGTGQIDFKGLGFNHLVSRERKRAGLRITVLQFLNKMGNLNAKT